MLSKYAKCQAIASFTVGVSWRSIGPPFQRLLSISDDLIFPGIVIYIAIYY